MWENCEINSKEFEQQRERENDAVMSHDVIITFDFHFVSG